MIDIDDASMKAMGRWPWDRSYHGKMIDILANIGAAAIGYDVLFDQPADRDGDTVLVNREGNGARQALGNPDACVISVIVGIVDSLAIPSFD